MGRRDDRAREAAEAAAAAAALELSLLDELPVPKVPGTVVTSCLKLGDGAAIVHAPAGVIAVPEVDLDDPTVVVLADFAECAEGVRVRQMTPAALGKLITDREVRAFRAYREAVAA